MGRALVVAAFVGALLTVLIGGHAYLAQRLVYDAALPPALATVLFTLEATLVAQPLGQRLLPRHAARFLAWPASLWMGVAFYLLVFFAFTDALLVLAGSLPQTAMSTVDLARVRALGAVTLALAAGAA